MKIKISRLMDISFVLLILFIIFLFVALFNLLFGNLPVSISVAVLLVAVSLTILLLGELERFLVFIGFVIVAFIFALTLNVEFTLTTSAVIIGIIVILVAMIS